MAGVFSFLIWHFSKHYAPFMQTISKFRPNATRDSATSQRVFVTMAFQARVASVFIAYYVSRAGLSQPRDNVTAKLLERIPAYREMCALRSASWYDEMRTNTKVTLNLTLYLSTINLNYIPLVYLQERVYIIQSNFAEIVACECSVCIN